MKKIILSVFSVIFAGTLFAEDAAVSKTELTFSVKGTVYATAFEGIEKDAGGSYSAFRMRPTLSFSNGSTEAVLGLEYDALFGAETKDDDKSTENVGISADKKGIEVAQAYVKTKVAAFEGLSLEGGIDTVDFPIVFGDNIPMLAAFYSNDKMNLGIYYLKTFEGDYKDNNDSEIYAADLTIKMGENSIRPAFFAYKSAKGAEVGQYEDGVGYMPALALNLAFGSAGIDFAGVYAGGKNKETDVKYAGYALDIAPYYSMNETVKLTGFFTMVSGDDPDTADKDESFLNSTIDGTSSGINLWRLYIIEDGGSFTTESDVAGSGKYESTAGYMAAGASLEAQFGDISTKFTAAYIRALQTVSGTKKDMGVELDANIGYEIAKGSTLYVEGAFLKSGKFYEQGGAVDIQNAYYANIGLNYEL
ncbi:MAG TPA: hypothetical protein PLA54_02810 [Spirochaetota bacterium]|nr:hypothetical protein [Spirochaetota bacterium]HQE58105.1 hypothetical protein [Spirochaetota bacterium]